MMLKTHVRGLETHEKARLISGAYQRLGQRRKGADGAALPKEKAEEFSSPQIVDIKFYDGCQLTVFLSFYRLPICYSNVSQS
jgi:hypothetical protein